jgi:diguanylate cyclase (GGDEF)-like protein
MSSTTAADFPDGKDPDRYLSPEDDRVALGAALVERSPSLAAEVASHVPASLRTEVEHSVRLATESVGRWLATGEEGAEHDHEVLTLPTLQVVMVEADLPTAVDTYLAWRDLCIAALGEDAARLGVDEESAGAARAFVQRACDVGLAAAVRVFGDHWTALHDRLRAQQADVARQILHDDLTGLPNRILLFDRLQRAARVGERRRTHSMLLAVDLDNFTAINDRFGHAAGDAVLVEVSRRLLEFVRASDTVARLGGDEFIILVEDLEEPEAAARSLSDRIHQAMCAPIAVGDRELHSSVSIGITGVVDGLDPDALLTRADAAMHRARRGGPARYAVYDIAIGAEHRRASRLADELRMAHARGELTLDFQPLYRLQGGTPTACSGMETQLRWDHPDFGTIEPEEFVPLLEHSRQIVPVGRWVLEEAASQCVEWQHSLPDLTMSVDVSTRQLHDPGFLEDVDDALRRSGLDPSHLILEVTEPALAVALARTRMVMQAVRELGVRMALDDFGTGHSPSLHLQGLPIDRLKLDRSVVAGVETDSHDGAAVRTVVDLAHRLGITVVAEGVETAAELRAAGAIGCDEAQGDLLGRPAPAHLHSLDVAHPVPSLI